ncbi:MAG: hypothetical protein ACI9MC_001382 [Kiritimatiellia bacterium]|jgi:hypothetical protein
MPRDVTLQLLARCSDGPPDIVQSGLTAKLAALNRHAASCSWHPTASLDNPKDLQRWCDGRGPMGVKMGFVFAVNGDIWLPHPAPGEISPTAGLLWSDSLVWAKAVAEQPPLRSFTIQEQHFDLHTISTRHIRLRALDWDGSVESQILMATNDLVSGVRGQLRSLSKLLDYDVAQQLHPLVRALHALN